jgi:hypothetical protein
MSRPESGGATDGCGKVAVLVAWRTRLLLRAGFSEDLAGEIAAAGRLDVLQLVDLVRRGCPPSTAMRILQEDGVEPSGRRRDG